MTVRSPQLFNSAAVSDIESFIVDGDWIFEQKVDGMRCLAVLRPEGVEFFTRGGRPLRSAAAKLHFNDLRASLQDYIDKFNAMSPVDDWEVVVDAELVTERGLLVLLDMPYLDVAGNQVRPFSEFSERRAFLRNWFNERHENICSVASYDSELDKRALLDIVLNLNLEGIIAKRVDSPYSEGERVKHSLKLKFTKTADVIVTAKNSGESKHSKRGGDKINYEFSVFSKQGIVHVGNCSGIGKEDAQVGDVIEVEYLYMGAGGKLVQPRMLKLRSDKPQSECDINQFAEYSKGVL